MDKPKEKVFVKCVTNIFGRIFAAVICMSLVIFIGMLDESASAEEYIPSVIGPESYPELGEEYYGYYRISNVEELKWFIDETKSYSSMNALLVEDIMVNDDLIGSKITADPVTGEPSVPAGILVREWETIPRYSGTFDGGGHKIGGFYLTSSESIGFISYLCDGGVVKNLTLEDMYVYSSDGAAGVVAGINDGEIDNVSVLYSAAAGAENVGGVVGENNGVIRGVSFVGSSYSQNYAGGITAVNYGDISYSYCSFASSVYGKRVGGIATESLGRMEYCYTAAEIGGVRADPVAYYFKPIAVFTSVYYLGDEEVDNIDGTSFKTREEFLSGEVCYLLNEGGEVYYQTVGRGEPTFEGESVFVVNVYECPGSENGEIVYTNTRGDIINYPDHLYISECDVRCEFCGLVRNTSKMHTYVNNCDEKCGDCGEIRKVQHTYANVCDADCDVCGAEREAAHSFGGECDPDCNLCSYQREVISHTYYGCSDFDCNVCGEIRAVYGHEYDNPCDGDCNECGERREPPHSYRYACSVFCELCLAERLSDLHSYTSVCDFDCNVCGFEREVEGHTYSSDCDGECNNCGEARQVAGHRYDNDCDSVCNICAEERVTPEHLYFYICSESCAICNEARVGASPHTFDSCVSAECSVCGVERAPGEHKYDNECGEICLACGSTRVVDRHGDLICGAGCTYCGFMVSAEHAYSNECDADCNICGSVRDSGGHRIDYDLPCSTKCSICGVTLRRLPDGVEHKYENNCSRECKICGEERQEIPHSYANGCDAVCDCGETRDAGHSYDHQCDVYCKACGEEREALPHTYDNACDIECNICGVSREVGDHIFDNDCDEICNECGAERSVPEHPYDNACDAECNVCGAERATEPHKYDNACDDECNVCKAKREVGEHQFGEYYTVLEPTKDADGIRSRKCEICGEVESEYIKYEGGVSWVVIVLIVVAVIAVVAVAAFILIKKFVL